jgi:eukaryotic-like serine/threonine-protein kinase
MTEQRWQQITQLFTRALEVDEKVRDTWLKEACGEDSKLMDEIYSLLEAHKSGGPLNESMENLHQMAFSTPAETFEKGTGVGPYNLEEMIGAGGMGIVYKARDTRLNRDVAIKFLPPLLSFDDRAKNRFLNEARMAATLDHPNVCTIYETGETDAGTLYMVMRYYEGETLRDRLNRETVPVKQAVNIIKQTAKGLYAAHKQGLVHRDIKPANLIITKEGIVKILDFGIAKAAEAGFTKTGWNPGTAAYMAPEQVKGEEVSQQADVWALGIVLFEMITGQRPFRGDNEASLIYQIVHKQPQPIQETYPEISSKLTRIINRTLEKEPENRYQSVIEFLDDLEEYEKREIAAEKSSFHFQTMIETLRKPGVALTAGIGLLAACILLFWFMNRQADIRWATLEAPLEIEQLIGENQYAAAFTLAREALSYAPDDPSLGHLLETSSVPVQVQSKPAGATFYYKPFLTPDAPWQEAGITPLDQILLPKQHIRWRAELDGHEPVEGSFSTLYRSLDISLKPVEDAVDDMVWIPAGAIQFAGESVEVEAFWLDRYEVTNREFARFAASGGYEDVSYWQSALDASDLTWDEAQRRFRDRTGRPGPAGWELGRPSDGTEELPVGGLSWYEAAAYCNFVDKNLPTIYHWRRATGLNREIYTDIHRMSNFEGSGPAAPGQYAGISRYGAYDMAGNHKEWVWNAIGDMRYILGGAWNESEKMYHDNDARPSTERGDTHGVRCSLHEDPVAEELYHPADQMYYDFSEYEPVADDVFEILKRFYDYQPGPIEVRKKETAEFTHWRRETVSINTAYSDERMLVRLYIPNDVSPPYQTVLHFPGVYAVALGSSENPSDLSLFDFIIRSGRVLVHPVYFRTYERYDPEATSTWRDAYIKWSQDIGQTIDYLETRQDIDLDNITYFGFSMGASPGPVFGAIHERLSSMILLGSGIAGYMRNRPPEAFPLNFAPRVQIPVLMVSGEDDVGLGPPEKGRQPLFDHFGTPGEHKRFVMLDGGHIPDDWSGFIRETLDWLDRYQGPVIAQYPQ